MSITEYLGLGFFEGTYLIMLAVLPFVMVKECVGILLVAIVTLYGILTIIKRGRAKKIDITGQGVLITGCDTGFGHDLARRLDSIGFTVYAGCLHSTGNGANALKTSITGRMHVLPLDVTSDESVKKCLEAVTKKCNENGLWALVNNAGVNCFGYAELATIQMYKRTAEINQFGVVRVTKAFLPLVRRHEGRVLNVTSVKGRLCVPLNAAYHMTKYAVEAFSDVLRLEMVKFGVKVIVIEPGHFGGVTAIANSAAVESSRRDNDDMWAEASEDSKAAYGRDNLDKMIEDIIGDIKNTAPTTNPVTDAMEDAVTSTHPQYRYLIMGSNKFFDLYCVLVWLNPYLPVSWMDYLINKSF